MSPTLAPTTLYRRTLLSVFTLFLVSLVPAMITKESLLTDEQQERLLPAAREYYDKAAGFMDRGNYTACLKYLTLAFEQQEDSAGLNFLLAHLAINRARLSFGKESTEYYNLAEKALKANLKIKNLSFSDRQDTERKLKIVQEERDNVPARDSKRKEIGLQFIREQLIFRGVDLSQKKEAETVASTSSQPAAPATTSGAAPATAAAPFTAPTGGAAPFAPAPAPFAPAPAQPVRPSPDFIEGGGK
ncbi:MAG: hypothetical protein Kow0059_03870 [Candidatus Sumerlaeia bacterium]